MAKRDIVLFLGAGFAADAGLPTMEGFGKESRSQLKKIEQQRSKKDAAALLADAGKVFSSFQEFCKRRQRVAEIDTDNMEEVFCVAEAMREAKARVPLSLRGPSSSRRAEPGSSPALALPAELVVEQIQLWLWKIYLTCPAPSGPHTGGAKTQRQAIEHKPYDEFFELLKKTKLRKRTTVITTNYDILTEFHYWLAPGEPCCAYPLQEGRDFVVLRTASQPIYTYINSSGTPWQPEWDRSDCLLVVKLHGSVNFFEGQTGGGPTLGLCDDLVTPDQFVRKSGMGKSELPAKSRRPAIFCLDAITALRSRYGNSLVPAIVPPTYAKLQGMPWLRRMWECAFAAIRDAKLIVFIGYGLPPSDGFMRALLQGAIASRKRPGPEIAVINPFRGKAGKAPCKEQVDRYRDLFPLLKTDKRRIVRKGFAQAWKDRELRRILEPYAKGQ